jgi:hypothetical protein
MLVLLTAGSATAQGPGGAAPLVDGGQPAAGALPPPAGGLAPGAPGAPGAPVSTAEGVVTQLAGALALAPAAAPPEVIAAVTAANSIAGLPYRWGGGHGSFDDVGYDCSGAVSKVLNAVGALDDPLDSTGLRRWGERGRGRWITVYANRSHAYLVIAGLRFDTSGRGGKGPRWRAEPRPSAGFVPRHPDGL